MSKKTLIIIGVIVIVIIINLIFIAYVFDSNIITTYADPESTLNASDLNNMPSPDNSIINRFFSTIIKPFIK